MKRIKGIKLYISLLTFALVAPSCSDFLDVNEDPNRSTDANITPELLFTQAETAIGARQANRFVFLNNWMGYWARSGSFAVEQEETTYNLAYTFSDNLWANGYNTLFDLKLVKDKALAGDDKFLAGAAMVLSAKLWQEQVDMFGAIPYTQAFDYLKYPRPAYDKAVDIYADLQKQLDTAKEYLKTTPSASFYPADMIVCRGSKTADVTAWIRLANTIKLRILLRQSQILTGTPTAELAKISTEGILKSSENIAVNPGYTNQLDKQSPFYGSYGLTPSGSAASTNNKANYYFYSVLKGNADPRLTRFYASPISATDYGALNGNSTPPHEQIVGTDLGPGLAGSATQDQWILPAFEVQFMKAEAVALGWLSGDAKSVYEGAVKSSFSWLGVPITAAKEDSVYLANKGAFPAAGTATADVVKFIAYQKYISLCGIDPLESWCDLRKLDMIPDTDYLSYNPSRTATHLPYLLVYPQTEYTSNSISVPKRTDIFSERLFWQPIK